jgi:hypothetical protein
VLYSREVLKSRESSSPVFRLHVRSVWIDGVGEVQCLITTADVDPSQAWGDLQRQAVERWQSVLEPPGDTTTLQGRISVMLQETGWQHVAGTLPEKGLVQRRIAAFRAQRVGDQIAILIRDVGALVDLFPAEPGEEGADAAARCGWRLGGRLPGWTQEAWSAEPRDWTIVLSRVQRNRADLQVQLAEREKGWRELLRHAQLAGVSTQLLTTTTGLTRQRLYQIRDRRR